MGPGERVCLFLDRVPELYLAFVGILKLGAVVQPLFSAFGDESLATRLLDAGTCCVVTQRKHLPKVRRARATLADLRLVVVVDAGDDEARGGRGRLRPRRRAARRELRRLPGGGRDAVGPPLHLGDDGAAEGGAARPPLARLPVPDDEVGPRPEGGRRLLVQRRPGLGDRDVVRDHRPLGERRDAGRPRRRVRRRALVFLPREAPRHRLVLGADRDPAPDEGRARAREASRPLLPPAPGERRRAAQPRGGPLVARGVRPAVPRHVLADGDGLHRRLELSRHADQGGLDGQALPRHHRGDPRPEDVRAARRAGTRRDDRPRPRDGPR